MTVFLRLGCDLNLFVEFISKDWASGYKKKTTHELYQLDFLFLTQLI